MDSKPFNSIRFIDTFLDICPNFENPPVKIQTRRQVSANRIETLTYDVQDIILTSDGVLLIRTTIDLGVLRNE